MTQYDPGSWAANRSDVGYVILTLVWSSVFSTVAAVSSIEGETSMWSIPAGLLGICFLIAVTRLGFRLANSNPKLSRKEAGRRLSDLQIMTIVGLTTVAGAVAVVAIVVGLAD